MTAGKNRTLDRLRREASHARRQRVLGTAADAREDVSEGLLRLVFEACHPALSRDDQVILTLYLIVGLDTTEIARALLVSQASMARRIAQAKRTLGATEMPLEAAQGEEPAARLAAVLEVVYLIFNEGYSATAGDDWMRPELCDEALRLGRLLTRLAPREAEVHGLVALMEIQASRLRARVDAAGQPILLLEQDRSQWDRVVVGRGLAALDRAAALGGEPGVYQLQAAIAACHARARTGNETDWVRIVELYDALVQLMPAPVAELNRAVAVGMAYGPATALRLVDTLVAAKDLQRYHLLGAVRGDLLAKLGRLPEARQEFERAAALTNNRRERQLLLDRARATFS